MRKSFYPDPTFLDRAEGIRRRRRKALLIILAVLTAAAAFFLFVRWEAGMQRLYEEKYPELVGAAGTTLAEESEQEQASFESSAAEPSASGEDETREEETYPEPLVAYEPPEQTPDPEDLSAQVFTESEPFLFRANYPLQTVSHERRDVLLDYMKQDVFDYINANPGERICMRYINLKTSETTGINDLEPIIPAGAFALPIELTYWHRVSEGFGSPNYIVTYDGASYVPGNSSSIVRDYPIGKMFYIRTLANLAVSDNDDYALSVILERSGGIDTVWDFISGISGFTDYTGTSTYTDYRGTLMRGTGRTSCYDMAAYAEYLYYEYIRNPEVYGPLINDMYHSSIRSPFTTSFGEQTPVLHVQGRNETFHAYTDIAIIDAAEPLVLIVYCECGSYDRAQRIEADISGFVASYINECHAS